MTKPVLIFLLKQQVASFVEGTDHEGSLLPEIVAAAALQEQGSSDMAYGEYEPLPYYIVKLRTHAMTFSIGQADLLSRLRQFYQSSFKPSRERRYNSAVNLHQTILEMLGIVPVDGF